MSDLPHLERACELLWETGHHRIAEALMEEVSAVCRAARDVLDSARISGSVSLRERRALAEALGLSPDAAGGRYAVVRRARGLHD